MRLAARTISEPSSIRSGWEIHHIALDRIRHGKPTILLTVGDSDFPSPPRAIEALEQSLRAGRTHYTESAGTRSLRAAIARRHKLISGQDVDPDQVIVTIGAQNALLTAALCLLDPGDEVIVPEPMYSTYPGTIAVAGAQVVTAGASSTRRFHPSIESIAKAVTAKTKAIFLATPNNPTGAVYSRGDLESIGQICERHDLWLVSDEVYASLVYEGTHVSPCSLPGLGARTATLSSLSKSHAMAGWRLGWMIMPAAAANAAVTLAGNSTYGIPTFVQDAAAVALDSEPYATAGLKEAYEARRLRFCSLLSNLPGVSPHWPEGGMFVMLDVRNSGLPSFDFAERLLRETGVAVLPADTFGPSAVGFLRVNLGAKDALLEEAASRIASFAMRLAEQQSADRLDRVGT